MIELLKVPVDVPSELWSPVASGFDVVLQHTPLAVIDAPPSLVIFPPPLAVVCVMFVMPVVESEGVLIEIVVKYFSLPNIIFEPLLK